ncbi:hypothetical protein N7548_00110 [Acholeplasma manati]|uniref:Uncharacterized protein n=1 Tax=Paracholeplasma manati TaxID=591373 RepID=A0ABT2YB37_9MOLU|nr:hypothetical protein [Paracholeplasma manati]MCV2231228.1 hypothetical protein [Paracholeplasma manati]
MGYNKFRWGTFEDNNKSALEYNGRMIQFLADSGVEVLQLTLEITELNTYWEGDIVTRDYDGKGSFWIDENDVERFMTYVDTFYKHLNPNEPNILSVILMDGDEISELDPFDREDYLGNIKNEQNTEDV